MTLRREAVLTRHLSADEAKRIARRALKLARRKGALA